jgi:FixJ family two-component response regulator
MAHAAIVLVDDDPAVRSSIAFALDVDGLEVRAFADAEAMLAWTADTPVACIVLDYHLPRMDGIALLHVLRARGFAAPAILITSNPTPRLRRCVAEAGGVLIEKPLLSDRLAASIRALVAPLPAAEDK